MPEQQPDDGPANIYAGIGAVVPVSQNMLGFGIALGVLAGVTEAEHRQREAHWGIDPTLSRAQRNALRKKANADYKALVKQRQAERKAGLR